SRNALFPSRGARHAPGRPPGRPPPRMGSVLGDRRGEAGPPRSRTRPPTSRRGCPSRAELPAMFRVGLAQLSPPSHRRNPRATPWLRGPPSGGRPPRREVAGRSVVMPIGRIAAGTVETGRSWLVAGCALGILSVAFGAPLVTIVALKPTAADFGNVRS